jgi:hypothetical protein
MKKKRTKYKSIKLTDLYKTASKLKKSEREKLVGRLVSKTAKTELENHWLSKPVRRELGLTLPATIYIQDPLVAEQEPALSFQEISIDWEPGLSDGPTSARVAVVDYDADTNKMTKPARWDADKWCFVDSDSNPIDQSKRKSPQFRQVSVWAVIHSVLDFYDDSEALGRPVSWAFEGNRLTVLPHLGYRENAFYDRHSKSLQFYYCGTVDKPVYTCLSHDIVCHETGHAVLDGIRPYYNALSSLQTAAFHEFVADLTAILVALRNNDFRHVIEKATKGHLGRAKFLANVAEQFSRHVIDRDYLRSAINDHKMNVISNDRSPHYCSQVLTGAMFEIMIRMAANYMEKRKKTPKQALYYTIDRFRRVALQPLDYCPPVDIQFADYADAVLCHDQLANPMDPYGYRKIVRQVFKKRLIPHPTDEDEPDYSKLFCYNIDYVLSSRAAIYHFLHESRKELCIPEHQDIVILEPYTAYKVRRARRKLPKEIVLQYIWREDVELKGSRFGGLEGRTIALLCGGTLVYDERGNLLYWCRKPGTELEKDKIEGQKRRKVLLDYVASCVASDMIGMAESGIGSIDINNPIVGRSVDGELCMERTPHLRHYGADKEGGDE